MPRRKLRRLLQVPRRKRLKLNLLTNKRSSSKNNKSNWKFKQELSMIKSLKHLMKLEKKRNKQKRFLIKHKETKKN